MLVAVKMATAGLAGASSAASAEFVATTAMAETATVETMGTATATTAVKVATVEVMGAIRVCAKGNDSGCDRGSGVCRNIGSSRISGRNLGRSVDVAGVASEAMANTVAVAITITIAVVVAVALLLFLHNVLTRYDIDVCSVPAKKCLGKYIVRSHVFG